MEDVDATQERIMESRPELFGGMTDRDVDQWIDEKLQRTNSQIEALKQAQQNAALAPTQADTEAQAQAKAAAGAQARAQAQAQAEAEHVKSFVVASACINQGPGANLLGEGAGAAGVYGFTSPTTKQPYAVKKISRHLASKGHNFKREVGILETVRHPGICNLITVITDERYHLLVFEKCKQELFDTVLESRGLPEPQACVYFGQIIDAVDYLHGNRIYHRDLKLENTMLTDKGKIKIIDFGLSKQCSINSNPGTVGIGTISYMAPEMTLPPEAGVYSGAPVDIWSLGVMLYVMVCCKYPFGYERSAENPGGKPAIEIHNAIRSARFDWPARKALSGEIKSLVTSMLTVDVSRRATIAQIREDPWMRKHGYVWSPPANIPSLSVNLDGPGVPALAPEPSKAPCAEPSVWMDDEDDDDGYF